MDSDRIKRGLAAFVRNQVPELDYHALYPAKVLKDYGDNSYDLEPDDARLPRLVKVPLASPIPGLIIKVAPDARVLLGWAAGNPKAPRVTLWETSENVMIVLTSSDIRLGSEGATKHVAWKEDVAAELDAMKATYNGHTHEETGAKTLASTAQMGATPNLGASKVKAE